MTADGQVARPPAVSADPRSLEPVRISIGGLPKILLILVGCAVLTHVIAAFLLHRGVEFPGYRLLFRVVSLDSEVSVATWMSTFLLLFAALAAAVCAGLHRQQRARGALGWTGVAAALAAASLDEIAQIHEGVNVAAAALVPVGMDLTWPWVIVGGLVVIVLAIVFTPFLVKLPPPVRLWMMIGAGVFVGGALGVELLSAPVSPGEGEFNLT